MKLYTTRRSPYARKVYVMAIEKGLKSQIQLEVIDLKDKPKELYKYNPIGAVPTLVMDNNKGLYDSPVIAEYIDSLSKENRMIPKRGKKRFYVLKISATADAMVEAAVKLFYEKAKGENADAATLKKISDTLGRCCKLLNKEVKKFSKEVDMASIAVASALGYINFRHADLGWQDKNEKLAEWFAEFSKRPSMKETEPRD